MRPIKIYQNMVGYTGYRIGIGYYRIALTINNKPTISMQPIRISGFTLLGWEHSTIEYINIKRVLPRLLVLRSQYFPVNLNNHPLS